MVDTNYYNTSYLRINPEHEISNILKTLLNILSGILFTGAVGLAALFFTGVIVIVGFDYKVVSEVEKSTFIALVSFVWMVVNLLMSFQFKKHKTFFYTIIVMSVVLFFNTIRLGVDTYQKYQEQQIAVCGPGEF